MALAHLWAGAPAPPEMLELILCRDVYHISPAELAEQDAATILSHLTVMEAEAQVQKARKRK